LNVLYKFWSKKNKLLYSNRNAISVISGDATMTCPTLYSVFGISQKYLSRKPDIH